MTNPAPPQLCPKCAQQVRDGWRVCPACLAPLDGATQTLFQQSSSSSTSIDEGRLPAGTVLAGRNRILGLLGHGGMGEVYRAFDLILNQVVALKFLAGAKMSEPALARFRNEVRVARQVSHPNVCRVYDIGIFDGLHFISMEYLDGEDLDSLIRRIGRLAQDKAIEFARKICAGLSAAHERGVLHRDLKPANIMIDGRGQVRITDFGLAALAAEIPLSDLRSGTPAYMSPEQKAGKEVTTRSDLYSLGLVLYEMFTGKCRADTQTNPTEIIKDLDPAVERVILRCLEEDPKRRPSSPFNVAMALPGGDPIAAALAAGETPSPEMVAASSEKEGFTHRAAIACFVATLACLAAGTFLTPKTNPFVLSRVNIPPEVLAFQAQELLRKLGYTQTPASTAYGFEYLQNPQFLRGSRAEREAMLATQRPPLVRFWYRQYQGPFHADAFLPGRGATATISFDSPANSEPGMIRLALDARGRLTLLEVRPAEPAEPPSAAPLDWPGLFAATGLDLARFHAATPQRVPPVAADTRVAWEGSYSERRSELLRVEGASWLGHPVFFSVGNAAEQQGFAIPDSVVLFLIVLGVPILLGAVFLAWKNLRHGRGDRGAAAAVGGVIFLCTVLEIALRAHHVMDPWELHVIAALLSDAGLSAFLIYLLYLAMEPYARRHWPDCLISWKRFQTGRIKDALVASHVLAGLAAMMALERFGSRLLAWMMSAPMVANLFDASLESAAYPIVRLLGAIPNAVFAALAILVAAVLVRLLVRRVWLADLIAAVGFALWYVPPFVGSGITGGLAVVYNIIRIALSLWLLRRFGLLAVAAAWFAAFLDKVPYSPGSWYDGRTLTTLAIPALLAAWALWVVLSAQRRPRTESVG